jgi:hypothetical protein
VEKQNNKAFERGAFDESYGSMSWFKSATGSLLGALGIARGPSKSALEEKAYEIRQAMLTTLGEPTSQPFTALRRRLVFAEDIEALWYLRSEWMAAMSTLHGERVAAAHLRGINLHFEGLLAKGMTSRPSPLSPP